MPSALAAIAALSAAVLVHGIGAKFFFLFAALGAFVVLGWTRIVEPGERESLREWMKSARNRSAPSA